jgi:prevent-host-death family protein
MATDQQPSDVVGAYEAKTHFSELLERVAAGEELTITRHGTPVARLVPVKQVSTAGQRRAIIERWIDRPDKPTLGGLKIRELINAGRR